MTLLSPVIADVKTQLTASLNEILAIDGYAHGSNNTTVGKLVPDPDWLASVRSRIEMLGAAGGSWTQQRPEIWSKVLVQFPNYSSAVQSLASMQKERKFSTAAEWVDILTSVLLPPLDDAATRTQRADASCAPSTTSSRRSSRF